MVGRSATRVLAVLDEIARRQPIGVAALTELLDENASAVRRAIATLADNQWIQPTPGRPLRYELTARVFAVAHLLQSGDELRRRARPTLRTLRDLTGETAFLAVPYAAGIIVIEAAESPHTLRVAPRVGAVLPESAYPIVRALLAPAADPSPHGEAPGPQFRVESDPLGLTTFAAPLYGHGGQAIAVIVVCGPADRLPAARRGELSEALAKSGQSLAAPRPRGRPGAASP